MKSILQTMPYPDEYTLVLIKPDGVEKEAINYVIKSIEELDLKIIQKRYLQLTPKVVREIFIHSIDRFTKYMSRSKVFAILVYGNNAFHKLRVIKPIIRKKMNSVEVENILHSPESGNEYDMQMRNFFPELNIGDYNNFADMFCKENLSTDYNEFEIKLKKICQSTSAKVLSFIIPSDIYNEIQKNFLKFINSNNKLKKPFFLLGMEYEVFQKEYNYKILGYFLLETIVEDIDEHNEDFYIDPKDVINLINKNGGTSFLSATTHLFNYQSNYFDELWDSGLKGAIVYHPRYTLKETDFLREETKGKGKCMSGGSGGISTPGRYGISYEIFHELFAIGNNIDNNAEWILG
ncbi:MULTISPECIES: nucleoside-diphosphate kinase [unclassified Planococcus (in: firmicutes)]|uniref:nucleoside-diphosphate kinase n=1 Tax=unclassified Planococcus (in: firmicutes) TaxID=2662419 RepID=UPI000C7A1D7A|nr:MULTISPECIES: nucleoside-diphosphate kinase [unclassified Planococcus (in: firmicutes)]PKG46512.1 hypothetical protein CXF66_06455 [Planococcus sp. Urea-trap-24]PKG89802.1 hypothetical protein CXF91_06350 [Planococcus sp. Urea-3u-39]